MASPLIRCASGLLRSRRECSLLQFWLFASSSRLARDRPIPLPAHLASSGFHFSFSSLSPHMGPHHGPSRPPETHNSAETMNDCPDSSSTLSPIEPFSAVTGGDKPR
ncbi:hypothetical protein VTK26DRAFT_3972 [Humicola hyalothermophila]